MKIQPLDYCAVEITDCDISNLSDSDYAAVKQALLTDLVVVIRNQPRLTVPFVKLVYRLGNGRIANWEQCIWNIHGDLIPNRPEKVIDPFNYTETDDLYPVQRVTGQKKQGRRSGIFGSGKLDWHSNMNGPTRANGVALQGVSNVDGTSTSWMDTTKAYEYMSDELKQRCAGVVGQFEYAPEIWAEGLPRDQFAAMLKNKQAYQMPLVNYSAQGKPGLYFHFHNKCSFPTDPGLLDALKDHCLQDRFIYTHKWQPGDIVLSDQVLTIHKRDQDDPAVLTERLLIRSTFHYSA